MQALKLPASRGYAWIAEALRLYRRNPLLLSAAVFSYWLFLLVMATVPAVGGLLMAIAMAMLTVGLYRIFANVANDQPVVLGQLVLVARERWQALAVLGAINFVASHTAMFLAGLLDGGAMAAMMSGKVEITAANMDQPGMFAASVLLLVLSTLQTMANWFAALLVGLRNVPPAKALFFSFIACLRNIAPFIVFFVAFGTAFIMFPVMLTTFLGGFGGILLLMLPLLILPTFYAAFYVGVKDIFGDLE